MTSSRSSRLDFQSLLDWAESSSDTFLDGDLSVSSISTDSVSSTTPTTPSVTPPKRPVTSPPRYNLAAAFEHVDSSTSPSRLPARYDALSAFTPPRRVPALKPTRRSAFVVHFCDTLEPVIPSPGTSLAIGLPVLLRLPTDARPTRLVRAFARYIGTLVGESGAWVGLELATSAVSSETGLLLQMLDGAVVHGVRYFDVTDSSDDWSGSRSRRDRHHRRRMSRTAVGGSGRCLFVRPQRVAWVKDAK